MVQILMHPSFGLVMLTIDVVISAGFIAANHRKEIKIQHKNTTVASERCTCNSLTREVADTNSLTICKLDMAD